MSPYRVYEVNHWSQLRHDMPMTLSLNELRRLEGLNDPISVDEVERIYLPLALLLSHYVKARQGLYHSTARFLDLNERKVPFIIGLAGSVSAGKSTTARVLQALLSRWPGMPKVDLVTTDGFLYPNAVLKAEGLMERKGFPESYDVGRLLTFLTNIKAGKRDVIGPVYSHLVYDVVPDETVTVSQPDILILEGLNVLQVRDLPPGGDAVPFVSDFFDFSIYLDADEALVRQWYRERFLRLRETAFRNPKSFFRTYADLTHEEASAKADDIWNRINGPNLHENILPTRQRADLILRKGANHLIDQVALRRL
ncbi:MAG: type I pantothenate kinase [Rhizobiales bacterium]|nr:type I pantothenate kinase [Hyphomicrobiales bacterium]